jgi:hypothetical protein
MIASHFLLHHWAWSHYHRQKLKANTLSQYFIVRWWATATSSFCIQSEASFRRHLLRRFWSYVCHSHPVPGSRSNRFLKTSRSKSAGKDEVPPHGIDSTSSLRSRRTISCLSVQRKSIDRRGRLYSAKIGMFRNFLAQYRSIDRSRWRQEKWNSFSVSASNSYSLFVQFNHMNRIGGEHR